MFDAKDGCSQRAYALPVGQLVTRTAPWQHLRCALLTMLIATRSTAEAEDPLVQLSSKIEIKTLGVATYFLSLEIQRDRAAHQLTLGQGKFARELIEKFNMADAKPQSTPMLRVCTLQLVLAVDDVGVGLSGSSGRVVRQAFCEEQKRRGPDGKPTPIGLAAKKSPTPSNTCPRLEPGTLQAVPRR